MDVIVHNSGGAEWWQILSAFGPLVALAAAGLTAWLGWRSLKQQRRTTEETLTQQREATDRTLEQQRVSSEGALQQRTEADARAEWWRRVQWALDHALQNDDESGPANGKENARAVGLAALDVLAKSPLAHPDDLELLDIAWKAVNPSDLDEAEDVDSDAGLGDNGEIANVKEGEEVPE